ncbi:CHAT domain-containing protein [Rhypophila decipiens]|uniref:CHAT domain-containing protein n=1 Tax=Rhypophila decipiens TaxID=261697 RepID=A0AAN7B2C5_9PEZI|nr:CHAT domain-containing protein [Rhypophila decipiens]
MSDPDLRGDPESVFDEYLDAAKSLYALFEESESKDVEILNNATGAGKLALASRCSDAQLMSQAERLWSWFNLKDDRGALDESIGLAESTVASSKGSPYLPDFLHSAHIERAVEVSRQAVDLEPDDDAWLSNLGSNLESRYSWLGDPTDLEESITYTRKSLEAASEHSPHLPTYLVSLGSKLQLRSEASGDGADADLSVNLIREGLDHKTAKKADRPLHLSMLASALANRYSRKSNAEDLLGANAILSSLLNDTSPTNPDRSAWISNLSNNYSIILEQKRIRHHITSEDLNRVIGDIEKTLDALPPSHSDRGAMCAALSTLLRARYKADIDTTEGNMNPEDGLKNLKLASFWMENATDHVKKDSLQRATFERNLGMQKIALCEATDGADKALLTSALDHLNLSIQATHASPLGKIEAIRGMIKGLCLTKDFDKARIRAREALDLLPLVCGRYRTLDDQQYAVMKTAGLAADCCSLSLRAGDGHIEEALEQLETGRGLILGYLMDDHGEDYGSHPSYDGLPGKKSVDKDLAEYERLRFKVSRKITTQQEPGVRERLLEQQKDAVQQLGRCIDRIRAHDGYENFLRALKVEKMITLAADGPIIVVNVTDIGADAVIISRDVGGEDNEKDSDGIALLPWLWQTCVEPVVEELDRLGLLHKHGKHSPSRVWWIGSGIASSLPFHAAITLYVKRELLDNNNNIASIISSYSTSLKALANARYLATGYLHHDKNDSAPSAKKISVLVVTMANTPNHNALPGAEKEGQAVKQACGDIFKCDILPSPNVQDVHSRIPNIDIFHYAGHGMSDPRNALDSHLLLQASPSTDAVAKSEVGKLTLGKISAVSLRASSQAESRRPRIACLSACSTAEVQAQKLADEGPHLAAAFQLAGFSHVIGSLWPADDSVCVQVAQTFYTELINVTTSGGYNKGGEPGKGGKEPTEISNKAVAVALQKAVSQPQARYGSKPFQWAPFIHLGP